MQKIKRGLKISTPTTSKYVGVYFRKNKNKYEATIWVNKKTKWLGRYDLEEEAAKAYNEAALKYFGSDAKLNIIKDI